MAGKSAKTTKTTKSPKNEKNAKDEKIGNENTEKSESSSNSEKTTKTAKSAKSEKSEKTSARAGKSADKGMKAESTQETEKEDKEPKSTKSNKTEAVMRLLTGGKKTAPNPILDSSFKVERITSKSVRKGANGAEIDITGELVTELLPQVLERFNCCRCAVCYAEAMAEAIDAVPTLKIRVNGKEDLRRADRMKMQSRREVLCTLIRLAIQRRRFPRHKIN